MYVCMYAERLFDSSGCGSRERPDYSMPQALPKVMVYVCMYVCM